MAKQTGRSSEMVNSSAKFRLKLQKYLLCFQLAALFLAQYSLSLALCKVSKAEGRSKSYPPYVRRKGLIRRTVFNV